MKICLRNPCHCWWLACVGDFWGGGGRGEWCPADIGMPHAPASGMSHASGLAILS